MKVAKLLFKKNEWQFKRNDDNLDYDDAQLVIGFGDRTIIENHVFFEEVKKKFPKATIALSSSAGEIICEEIYEESVVVGIMSFEKTQIKTSQIDINDFPNSYEAGVTLIKNLPKENLRWVFVLSDGSNVNGSELVQGMNANRPENVLISGGLAGDGGKFEKTVVGLNQTPMPFQVIAIGFYGDHLQLAHASYGGWESFGLERNVTLSKKNVLYEVDDKNVLDLYKKYLGKYAEELPSSALLFPLSLQLPDEARPVVRSILSINENDNSMTFAGDLPVGSKVRFMKANIDRLIDAANDAANECITISKSKPKLGIIISCVGRKLVLGERSPEEAEMVRRVFKTDAILFGFYSYGEISPFKPFEKCALHNQTITISTINEIV